MKRVFQFLIFVIMTINPILGVGPDDPLPAPRCRQNGMSLDEALRLRRSVREFDPAMPISRQQISDILWAASGINRPEEGKLTSPTAMNTQEIDLYVFDSVEVCKYIPKTNSLRKISDGDHRGLLAGTASFSQDFVKTAPVVILIVADCGKFETPAEKAVILGSIDAGFVSENIYLFCTANGLGTVARATMDVPGLRKLLHLSESQIPVLNNPVGYPLK